MKVCPHSAGNSLQVSGRTFPVDVIYRPLKQLSQDVVENIEDAVLSSINDLPPGNKGDVLIAISTSGKSESIIEAIKTAKDIGMQVISLTGLNNNEMNKMSDICINTPSKETNHIQEMHITIGQLICGLVENELFNK